MQTSVLRKVGGSVMLSLPLALLDRLGLSAGSEVGIDIENGRLVVQAPPKKRKYTLSELLAQCDYTDGPSDEDLAWDRMKPAGREIL